MRHLLNLFFVVILCGAVAGVPAVAADLGASASVNITSDTAATAKNMAFVEARRQIVTEALGAYAIPEQFAELISGASDADLTNLIATSVIDGEKISDTTYSANITMTLDRGAAKKWLDENGVQNWLRDAAVADDRFVTVFTLTDAITNWMTLNQILRAEKIPLTTMRIHGTQVTASVPMANRARLIVALRENGWRTMDQDGLLRVWK